MTPTFHPEQIGTPHYATDLARRFSAHGWRVQVVTAQPFYPQFQRYPGYDRSRRYDELDDIEILRLPTFVPTGGKPVLRAINEANFAIQGLARSWGRPFDSVLSISPGTPWVSLVGRALCAPSGRHVTLVHDIQSGLAASLSMTGQLTSLVRANEAWSLNRADHIVALSNEMVERLRAIGVDRPSSVLPNWVTIDVDKRLFEPPTERSVQYSGNFGNKQGVDVLLELARRLAGLDPSIELILRGSGAKFEQLQAQAQTSHLTNICFEAPVSHDDLASALARSPVHVVTQAPGSASYAMPSKVVNALACGATIVAMTDSDSSLAKLATEIDGIEVVNPSDVEALAEGVMHVIDRAGDPETRRSIAREANRRFDGGTICSAFGRLVTPTGRAASPPRSSRAPVPHRDRVRSAGPRIDWITNIPTPYRVPLWEAIGRQADLRVICMAEREPNRVWNVDPPEGIELNIIGARSVRIGRWDATLYLPGPSISGALDRRQLDAIVIDGWESPAYWQVVREAHRRGVPVVASYRSTHDTHRFERGPVAAARQRFFSRVESVLTAGPASTEAVRSIGVAADRIVTGFNAVDVERFNAGAQRLRRAPLPGHRYLYVGQLIERKNVCTALDAFATIAEPDDSFTIVGTGPLEGELRTRATTLGLDDRVVFAGHHDGDALVDDYAQAGTYVLPSTEEVWGLVVNEALAAGCHAVVSARAGIVPSIRDMPGVFVTEPDSSGLEQAMRTSRAEWAGPIWQPPILEHTPDRAADAVVQAVLVAANQPCRHNDRGLDAQGGVRC